MPLPRKPLGPLDQAKLDGFAIALDELRASAPDRPLVLYTSISLSHNYLKLLRALRQAGALVVLHLADGRMCGSTPVADLQGEFFDLLLVSNPYLLELPALAERYPFDAIHASVGTGSPWVFAELVRRSRSPVIIDYFDFREVMAEDADTARRLFGVQDLELERRLWREIFTGCAGMIYMDSPEIVDRLAREHGHRPEALHFQSYVCEEWAAPLRKVGPEAPSRIVFAGGLHRPGQHAYGVHESFLDGVRRLLAQGYAFTVVNGCDPTGEGFEEYTGLTGKDPTFGYRTAMPNHRLTPFLAGFDLGWNAQNMRRGFEAEYYFRTLMSSKIFNYLEAGLPVVVSAYNTFLAGFVREHGIGLAITWSDWDNFGRIAAGTDWQALHAGVAGARESLSMGRHLPRLLDFYNRVCGRTLFTMPEEAPCCS